MHAVIDRVYLAAGTATAYVPESATSRADLYLREQLIATGGKALEQLIAAFAEEFPAVDVEHELLPVANGMKLNVELHVERDLYGRYEIGPLADRIGDALYARLSELERSLRELDCRIRLRWDV